MSKHKSRTITGIVTQLHKGIDAIHNAEIARLKAQNAELLEALDDLLFCLDVHGGDHCETEDSINHARAAIAKAKEQSK